MPNRIPIRGRRVLAVLLVVTSPLFASEDPEAEPESKIEEISTWDRIEEDGAVERRTRTVVHLPTSAAVLQWSQVGVGYAESNEKAEVTTLRLVKPDGRELDVLATAPRSISPLLPPDLPVHSDFRFLRLSVPNLAAGDRIVLETLVRSLPLDQDRVWTEFAFHRAPTGRYFYQLDLPAKSRLFVHVRPGLAAKLEESTAAGRHVRSWRVEEQQGDAHPSASAPASESADSGTAEAEPSSADVLVSSFANWEELGRWWRELAPPEITEDVRAKAAALTRSQESDLARLRSIHGFVAREIRYLALPLGLDRFRARSVDQVLSTGLGDCKDKHRLLASLAAAAGIEVDAFLLHVTGSKLVDSFATPLQFDHVISRARIGREVVWMDATSEMTPTGSLPSVDRGIRGVLVAAPGREAAEIVETPSEPVRRTEIRADTTGSIAEDGTLRLLERWTFQGDDVEWARLAFKYGDDQNRRALVRLFSRNWKETVERGEPKWSDPDALEEPFWVEFPLVAERPTGWKAEWDLRIPLADVEVSWSENDAELELGGAWIQRRTARIEVPEGVTIEAPLPVETERDFAKFRSVYRVEGRSFVIERDLERKLEALPAARAGELEAFEEILESDWRQGFGLRPSPEALARFTAAGGVEALVARCAAESKAQRYAEAEVVCRQALALDERSSEARKQLGWALGELGREADAEVELRRQIELHPNDPWAYTQLALSIWKRDPVEAEALLRKHVDLAPFVADPHIKLGRLLRQKGVFEEAHAMLQRALKLVPDSSSALEELVPVLFGLGRVGEAVALLSRHPELPTEFAERGEVALQLSMGAVERWEPLTSWNDKLIEEAERRLAIEHPERSAEAHHAAAVLAAGWALRGRIAAEAGKAAEAAVLLEASLDLFPTEPTSAALGATRRSLGESAGAGAGTARARTIEIPAAPKFEGQLWIVFGPDGRTIESGPLDERVPVAIARQLAAAVRLPTIQGNHARIPVRADAHCTSSGRCFVMIEPSYATWRALSAPAGI